MAYTTKITVTKSGAHLECDNHEILQAVAEDLSCRDLKLESQNGQIKPSVFRWIFFKKTATGLKFDTPLLTRVMNHCVTRGCSPTLIDKRRASTKWRLCPAAVEDSEKWFPGLAAAISEHREGRLIVASNRDKKLAIARTCLMLPDAKIFVVASTRDRQSDLTIGFETVGVRDFSIVGGSNWCSDARVVSGLLNSLESNRNPQDFDVLIFEDAQQGNCEIGRRALAEFGNDEYANCKIFAFARRERGAMKIETLEIENLFGPVIYPKKISRPKPVVNFLSYLPDGCDPEPHPPSLSPLEKRRKAWHHPIRNAAIAELCHNLDVGNLEGLENLSTDQASGGSSRIVVIVDSVEQARALHRLMPKSAVLTAEPGSKQHLGFWHAACTITTLLGAEQLEFSVAVMAIAGNQVELPDAFWRQPPRTIIDLDDRWSSEVADQTHRRKESYIQHGFSVGQIRLNELSAKTS